MSSQSNAAAAVAASAAALVDIPSSDDEAVRLADHALREGLRSRIPPEAKRMPRRPAAPAPSCAPPAKRPRPPACAPPPSLLAHAALHPRNELQRRGFSLGDPDFTQVGNSWEAVLSFPPLGSLRIPRLLRGFGSSKREAARDAFFAALVFLVANT